MGARSLVCWEGGCTSRVLCQLQEAPGVALPRMGPLIRLSVQHPALCTPFWEDGTPAARLWFCSPTPQRLLAPPGWRGFALLRTDHVSADRRNALSHLWPEPRRAVPISHLTSTGTVAVNMAPVLCSPTSALLPSRALAAMPQSLQIQPGLPGPPLPS